MKGRREGKKDSSDQRSGRHRVVTTRRELLPPSVLPRPPPPPPPPPLPLEELACPLFLRLNSSNFAAKKSEHRSFVTEPLRSGSSSGTRTRRASLSEKRERERERGGETKEKNGRKTGKTKTNVAARGDANDEIGGGGGSRCWQCWQLTRKGIDGAAEAAEARTRKRGSEEETASERGGARRVFASVYLLETEKAGRERERKKREEVGRFSIRTGKPEVASPVATIIELHGGEDTARCCFVAGRSTSVPAASSIGRNVWMNRGDLRKNPLFIRPSVSCLSSSRPSPPCPVSS